jgi:XTP/dITP diphosphohydrolase
MPASHPLRLFCASSNPGKLREFRLASGGDVQIEGLPPLPCPENGFTFEQNAVSKALCYSRAVLKKAGRNVERPLYLFADDSGLVVDALGGEPGVHSARYSGAHATDASNNQLLLERMHGVAAEQRTARFICCIALALDGELVKTFHGTVEGRILEAPAGANGFGYDPLFYCPPLSRGFGELPDEEKWAHSHRGRAFRQLLGWVRGFDSPP